MKQIEPITPNSLLDDMDISARSKQWEIFSPDWDYLLAFPVLNICSLVGLSVGLHPYFSHPDWVTLRALPYFYAYGLESNLYSANEIQELTEHDSHIYKYYEHRLIEFIKRINIAVANFAPHGNLNPIDGFANGINTQVRIADFIVWSRLKGWTLPERFNLGEPERINSQNYMTHHKTFNKEIDKWLFDTWANSGNPGGAKFFRLLEAHVLKPGSPIKSWHGAGPQARIEWESSGGASDKMSKKTIENKVSKFRDIVSR